MKLIQCYQKNSTWYKEAVRNSQPVGVLWHDTAAGNPTLKRYVQPHETDSNYQEMIALIGKNIYNNDLNHIEYKAGLNAWIGELADESIATIQAGDWTTTPWGCDSGSLGSCNGYIFSNGATIYPNKHWVQFEICDDGYNNADYFAKVYKEAVELTAFICAEYNIDPYGYVEYNGVQVPTILCHADSHQFQLGGNHGDVLVWFQKMGKTMDDVRHDVANLLGLVSDVEFEELDVVKIKERVTTYANGQEMASWIPNSTLYVRGFQGTDKIVISTLKEGAVSGVVWARDLILIEKAQKKQEPIITIPGTPSTGSEEEQKIMWDFLMSKFENEYAVAGLMGNLYGESGLISNNLQDSYQSKLGYTDETYTAAVDNETYTNFVDDSAGYGLAQWTFWSRKEKLLDFAKKSGKSVGDYHIQLEFLWDEMEKLFVGLVDSLKSATSVKEASDLVLHEYEGPSDQSIEMEIRRANYGQMYYDKFRIEEELETEPNEQEKENDTPKSWLKKIIIALCEFLIELLELLKK